MINDRERHGFTVGQVAWRLDVKPQVYPKLDAATAPSLDTYRRICELYGWPQTFVGDN